MKLDFRKKTDAVPFEIETDDGAISVAFTKLTIADAIDLGKLQADAVNGDLTDGERTFAIGAPKIVLSLKTLDGERVFDSAEDLAHISGEMFFWLIAEYDKVNPTVVTGDTFDAKKKKS